MPNSSERLVTTLSELHGVFDDVVTTYVTNHDPSKHKEGTWGHEKAQARLEAYEAAREGRTLVAQLEIVNDRIIAARRRLR